MSKIKCDMCGAEGILGERHNCFGSMPAKPPTLDTAPHDLAHAPEVPHHRFSVFHESGEYAYARGLEVNPTHLPLALDAMAKSGWRLISLFGQTDAKHVGFIFRRGGLGWETEQRLRARIDDLLRANNELVEQRREATRIVAELESLIAASIDERDRKAAAYGAIVDRDAGIPRDLDE